MDAAVGAAAAAPPLGGTLQSPDLWQAYKSAFVSPGGRVVDNANGDISHSEGQGYAMLLAVAADDRSAFDEIWGWTRAQLMLREDGLAASMMGVPLMRTKLSAYAVGAFFGGVGGVAFATHINGPWNQRS